jgi:hypothetical protein
LAIRTKERGRRKRRRKRRGKRREKRKEKRRRLAETYFRKYKKAKTDPKIRKTRKQR